MKISRFLKTILYLVLTAILLGISTSLQLAFHRQESLAAAYFQSNLYLFIMAAACLGTAVYSYRAYTRRHREHAADSLFLLLLGIVLMVAAVLTMVSFGGLGEEFTKTGYTAANVNIVLMSALPLPFLIRAIVLAVSCGRHEPSRRTPALIACGVVAAAYVLCLALGGMMRMVRYDPQSPYTSFSSEQDESVEEAGI